MVATKVMLAVGRNNRLFSITTRLSNICVKYLAFKKNPVLDMSEQSVIDKGLRYLEDVDSGIRISKGFKQRKFSFDHKTIEDLNAYATAQVFLHSESVADIEKLLRKVKETLNAIKNKDEIEEDYVTTSISFFKGLSDAVANDVYNPEASHIL